MKQSKTFTCALIGCGRVGIKHLRAIEKNSGIFSLAAIADTSPQAPQRLFEAAGFPQKKRDKVRLYTDYLELLEKEKPDITAITTPSGLHYKMASDALFAGSHILLEKPMTMNAFEAKELCDISEKTEKKIAMGHIFRYFPIVGLLREDILNGIFGTISHGTVLVRAGHDQAYYDQAAWRGSWKSDGGVLMNQTIHALDLLCWLMGSRAVSTVSSIAKRHHIMEAEDVGLGILELENGALCQVEGTTNTPDAFPEASFTIIGSKGSASLGLKKGRPFFDIRDASRKNKNRTYFARQLKISGWRTIPDFFNPHIGIYKDLAAAIQENRPPIADALSGYTSVEMVLGLYQSARDKRKIRLPLDAPFSSTDMSGFFK